VVDRENEILSELEQQIRANAFKAETFLYPIKDKQGLPYTLHALTHVYILDKAKRRRSMALGYRVNLNSIEMKNGCIINVPENDLRKIEEQNRACEKFIRRVASVVYRYRQAEKEVLAHIEKSTIDDTRRFLENQIYGKRAVNAAMKILKKDLKAQIRKNIDFFYPPPSKKQSPPYLTICHENEALFEMYGLYNQYFPTLKPRKILANMAFIAAATDFWQDDRKFIERVKLYFERLGNRKRELEEPDNVKIQTSFVLPGEKPIPLKD